MDTISQKIPFMVSARTARLIGRENIATSKGAIIELVKNGYDADSRISVVFFDNIYSAVHFEISHRYYNTLITKGIPKNLLDKIYSYSDGVYSLIKDTESDDVKEFKSLCSNFTCLYIIDTGEGMTQSIIRNHWMTIGTDNKANNYFTKTGRVKSGAKGIGRFALDKLGSKCEMTTIFNPKYHDKDVDTDNNTTNNQGYKWFVNWEDFEGEFKTIQSVNAELVNIKEGYLYDYIKEILPQDILNQIGTNNNTKYGTILKITDLRDSWDDYFVNQVYSDLEVLVPPKEASEFHIYLFSSLNINNYGEIAGSVCDDFDYKIIAKADNNQNVTIRIIRNEYDTDLIPKDFFERPKMSHFPYDQNTFREKYWECKKKFTELLPGFSAIDNDNTFDNIGNFEFTFYFLKKTFSTSDANRFFYRRFQSNFRKDWLDKFGGIKLFRDNFRVRPYGEVKDIAFDWLGLGGRKASSPAGVAKEDGGYKVEPENIAGAIKISRLTNVNFEDKSSREGLQDNKTFQVFKQLIAAIIGEFESDRSYIAREMAAYDDNKYGPERNQKAAKELAKKILEDSRRRKGYEDKDPQNNIIKAENSAEREILASQIESQEEEIEKLKSEQKVLRGLASGGIVLASFTHDLGKLSQVLSSRTDKLKEQLLSKIPDNTFSDLEDWQNPFVTLERIKTQDVKIQNWLNFSIGSTRKDKRKRKQLYLRTYFDAFKRDWATVLNGKGIDFDIEETDDIDLRIYEIDLDSIYNNLLVNSMEAFRLLKINRRRIIKIKTLLTHKEIVIDYLDNGPGLSDDIEKPEWIFEPMNTTKRNPQTGEEIGTGLGMWLVKSVVTENDGNVKLLYPEIGFGIRISFPIKYKR